jgi:hypothetical protein
VKVYLQGPFGASAMNTLITSYIPLKNPYNSLPWSYSGNDSILNVPAGMVDWVLLELRSTTTTIIARRAALLKSDGNVVDLGGSSPVIFSDVPDGNYYIVVKHRNHLAVMSASMIALSSVPVSYDFTSAMNKAYGTNPMKDLGFERYAMWSGDVNGDGIVRYNGSSNDRGLIYARIGGGSTTLTITGYEAADLNLDGTVKYNGGSNDRGIIYNNIGGGSTTSSLMTQVPAGILMNIKNNGKNDE